MPFSVFSHRFLPDWTGVTLNVIGLFINCFGFRIYVYFSVFDQSIYYFPYRARILLRVSKSVICCPSSLFIHVLTTFDFRSPSDKTTYNLSQFCARNLFNESTSIQFPSPNRVGSIMFKFQRPMLVTISCKSKRRTWPIKKSSEKWNHSSMFMRKKFRILFYPGEVYLCLIVEYIIRHPIMRNC